MEPSSDPGTEPVLAEGHYTVVLAGAGHRTLAVTRAGPDFQAGPCASRSVGGGELSDVLVAEALLCAALDIGLGESELPRPSGVGLGVGMALLRRATADQTSCPPTKGRIR